MKLKARIFVGALAFLMGACALMPKSCAMASDDDDKEVPADLGGVGAIARNSLVVAGSRLQDPQQQLFVAAQAGNLAEIINLARSVNVHTRAVDGNGDTMWHILVRNRKWGVIRSLLTSNATSDAVRQAVADRCRKSFADCIGKRNSQGKTPYDLARDVGLAASLKSSIPGDLPPELRSKLPIGLKNWR